MSLSLDLYHSILTASNLTFSLCARQLMVQHKQQRRLVINGFCYVLNIWCSTVWFHSDTSKSNVLECFWNACLYKRLLNGKIFNHSDRIYLKFWDINLEREVLEDPHILWVSQLQFWGKITFFAIFFKISQNSRFNLKGPGT